MANSQKETIRANWKVFLACGVMILAPFQYGVDFGMIGGLQAMIGFLRIYGYRTKKTKIGWNITTERQQLISSLMILGAFISSALTGVAAAKLGRRACLWIACVVCVAANIIMMTTTNIGALYAGRLIIGLANGWFMTFSQLYIQESSPAKYRGLFLTLFTFSTSFGTMIGTVVDWKTAKRPDKSSYLIPLGIIYIVPFFITLAMPFIPESPRWLILQGRYEAGVKSLAWMRPHGSDVDAEATEIKAAIDKEKALGSEVGALDMFRNPIDRRRTILAICAITLQAASGSMYIISYKAYFFTIANVHDPFAMTIVLSIVGLCAIATNSSIVIRYGSRRRLLLAGELGCGTFQLIIALIYHTTSATPKIGKVLVALTALYMFCYSGMIASMAWLAGGEIPSQRLRSHTFGLATGVGFVGAWLTTFTAPYFINPASLNWGPRYGFIWFPSCIIGAAFVFFFLPETYGRTLEEIDEMFGARLPARKFRSYKCVGVAESEESIVKRSIEEEKVREVLGDGKVTAETTTVLTQ